MKTNEKSRKGVVVLWFLLFEIVFAFLLKHKKKIFKRLTFFKIIERCRVIPLFRLSQRFSSLHMDGDAFCKVLCWSYKADTDPFLVAYVLCFSELQNNCQVLNLCHTHTVSRNQCHWYYLWAHFLSWKPCIIHHKEKFGWKKYLYLVWSLYWCITILVNSAGAK